MLTGDALAGGDGAAGDLERTAQIVLLEALANGVREPGRLGRHGLQLEQLLGLKPLLSGPWLGLF